LTNIYKFARLAKGKMPERQFRPIVREAARTEAIVQTMAQSQEDLVTVVFQVDCRDMYVRKAVYIVGSHELLGNWVPNKVRMYDDGTHGDTGGDGIWTLEVQLPPGTEVHYKFTNSGGEGSWYPGEEFADAHRTVWVSRQKGSRQVLLDRFGKI
jgi:hypothetical protein